MSKKVSKKENKDREVRAVAKYVQTPPRKVRYVIDTIRGKKVSEAMTLLKFTHSFAAGKLEKVLKSAVANAENNFDMDVDRLYISKAYVDPGPTMKRHLPRAMGRASLIFKRSSHITIAVMEKGGQ
ncbi:MAG: 50S ribosomal protein L22 [Armatimonadota bacterium]